MKNYILHTCEKYNYIVILSEKGELHYNVLPKDEKPLSVGGYVDSDYICNIKGVDNVFNKKSIFKVVDIKFKHPEYNYSTSISAHTSNIDIKLHFGDKINVAENNWQEIKSIEIEPKLFGYDASFNLVELKEL